MDDDDDTEDVGVEQVELGWAFVALPAEDAAECLAIFVGVGDRLDCGLRFTAYDDERRFFF